MIARSELTQRVSVEHVKRAECASNDEKKKVLRWRLKVRRARLMFRRSSETQNQNQNLRLFVSMPERN